MQYDRRKLGLYLAATHPDKFGPFSQDLKLVAVDGPNGEALAEIAAWPEGVDLPTKEQVEAMEIPAPPDTLDSCEDAISKATTVTGLKNAVLRLVQVLRNR